MLMVILGSDLVVCLTAAVELAVYFDLARILGLHSRSTTRQCGRMGLLLLVLLSLHPFAMLRSWKGGEESIG